MTFRWKTKDGTWHTKKIENKKERLKFIEWLEYSKDVVIWE